MDALLVFLARAQRIDRRILYLLLAFVVSAPFLFTVPVAGSTVSPQTQSFYETIEQVPTDQNKIVVVCTNYGAGTLADNQTQAEAVMRHLMKRHLKFAIFAFNDPQGRELGQQVATKIEAQYGYQYGRDYVNWGYRPADAIETILKAAVRDIPDAIGSEVRGAKVADVPMMKGIRGVDDVSLIIEITPSNTLPTWLQFYQRTGKHPVPTLFCPTPVMAAEAFPYLKSGQLQGMLVGLKGTIEYEGLIKEPGFATRASASLSYSHLLIILLIVLGNVGMVAARRVGKGT